MFCWRLFTNSMCAQSRDGFGELYRNVIKHCKTIKFRGISHSTISRNANTNCHRQGKHSLPFRNRLNLINYKCVRWWMKMLPLFLNEWFSLASVSLSLSLSLLLLHRIFTTFTKKRRNGKKIILLIQNFPKWFSLWLFFSVSNLHNFRPDVTLELARSFTTSRSSPKISLWGFLLFGVHSRTKHKNRGKMDSAQNLSNVSQKSLFAGFPSPLCPIHATLRASSNPYASITHEINKHFLQLTAQKIKNFLPFASRQPVTDLIVANSDFFHYWMENFPQWEVER